ncbi:phosphatase PAP2 family protein [Pseudalkalibacillus sp. SCS-8]|uniref:phosphatase PAP2 family protein n=1 Tax=Pseudalkalibacillus nanhaiensis TaxID=3115291 RepID=UPI0032DA95DF
MSRVIGWLHERECSLFHWVNNKCQHTFFGKYFMTVTHAGGATGSIVMCLLLMSLNDGELRMIGFQCLLALAISHLPVQVSKKLYPRKRPYQVLPNTITISKLLKDHSFPSGHTTAIFSVVTPLVLWNPLFAVLFIPLSLSVAISRIYLGLHYPSDVFAGMLLGIGSGLLVSSIL